MPDALAPSIDTPSPDPHRKGTVMRRLILVLAAAIGLAAPAQAFDIEAMTAEERAAFGEAVRGYLLRNPEVLEEMVAVLEERQTARQADLDRALIAANADALFAAKGDWVGGNPEGDLTLVEFLDYRCGFCRRAHPEVAELIESDGDIRLIVKELPILGPQSELASRFALAVKAVEGDDAYAATGDALMAHEAPITDDALRTLAQNAGYDVRAILAEMGSDAITAQIGRTLALAQALGIQGTPTFVLGRETMLRGYMPLGEMRALVDEVRGAG